MAMGGSTGQQSGIIVVRGLATGEISPRDLRRRLSRENALGTDNRPGYLNPYIYDNPVTLERFPLCNGSCHNPDHRHF